MREYVREGGGKLTKNGEKYFDDFIDDFWKLIYLQLISLLK